MTATSASRPTMPLAARIVVAVVIGLAVGVWEYRVLAPFVPLLYARDFTIPWQAARGILQHVDAYQFVRTAPHPIYGGILFYPLTAGVVALPFAAMSAAVAGASFIAVSIGLLAFALTAGNPWRLLVLSSAPLTSAAGSAQWSPLLTAAALITPALGLIVVKPNLALPLLAMQTRWRAIGFAVVGGGALLAVTFALQPDWPWRWIEQFQSSIAHQYQIPVLHPFGIVAVLAAMRWRNPDARLVLAMALIPQTGFFYEQLPLILVAKTRLELLAFALITHAGAYIAVRDPGVSRDVVQSSHAMFPYVLASCYLPALVMVLRRENVGRLPAWLERRTTALPTWLRGAPEIRAGQAAGIAA